MDILKYLKLTKNYPVILCIIFAIFYLVFTNYSYPIGFDESEYASIGKSLAQGNGFEIYQKPTTTIVTIPVLISFIWQGGFDYETTLIISRILFSIISVINLFLITNFLKKVIINGTHLSVNQILLIQLLTFGNFSYWSSKGTMLTEPLAVLLLFSIINILNKNEHTNLELIFTGILSSLLILTKYVTIVIIGAFIISSIYRFGYSKKSVRAILFYLIPLFAIIIPIFMRAYFLETSSERIVGSNFERFSQSDSIFQNSFNLAITGLLIHLEYFIELYSTFYNHKSIILSLIFSIPILIFIYRSIKNKEIFNFYVLFSVFYILGLIISGTGFSRYWLLILPMLNLFLVYQISSMRIFRLKLKMPDLLKSNIFKKIIYIFGILFSLSICYLTFQNRNLFIYKEYLTVYCFFFFMVLTICILARKKYFYLYTLIFLLIITFHLSRSVSGFMILSKSLSDRFEELDRDEIEISGLFKEKTSVPIYTDGYKADWTSLMTNNFVRHKIYKYDDEARLSKIFYIERNKLQEKPMALNREFSNSRVFLRNNTFIVFEIDLH